jgi:uncharacterized membrane protein
LNLRDPDTMNVVIGNVLRFGVIVSAVVVVLGVARLALLSGSAGSASYLLYNTGTVPHGTFPISLSAMLSGLGSFDPTSLIELGVIILIATPVSRVAISVFLFAAEKDELYVVVTAVVLVLLLFSMLVTPFIPAFHA